MKIILPWPPAKLWPNRSLKSHWAANSTAHRKYKEQVWGALLEQRVCHMPTDGNLRVVFTFIRKDRVRYDLDNARAAIKCGTDAIAQKIGVDDYYWTPQVLVRGDPDKDNPRVEVELI